MPTLPPTVTREVVFTWVSGMSDISTPATTTTTSFFPEELYYLRGLLCADGHAERLAAARGDDQRVSGSYSGEALGATLSQVLLGILEQERAWLPRWGVDYSDLATKIDGATEADLRDLYDRLRATPSRAPST